MEDDLVGACLICREWWAIGRTAESTFSTVTYEILGPWTARKQRCRRVGRGAEATCCPGDRTTLLADSGMSSRRG
ncbi:hypothetical protein BD311DRAFT_767048 [Dichomitus squalens]|uniref:Uncharacterized protein n=1 Tax=Dichomitus squalens TaxID=114155 RepID=A0A4Q9MAL0_9APHY|nr:hypothetical protein BD311DRAFT_767048 [Dichomitus squalens]